LLLNFTKRIDVYSQTRSDYIRGVYMKISNISEAKAHFSGLIEKVIAGEEIIIGKAGKPVAKLVKYESKFNERKPGALKGKIKIADDFEILPDDMAKAFGIKG